MYYVRSRWDILVRGSSAGVKSMEEIRVGISAAWFQFTTEEPNKTEIREAHRLRCCLDLEGGR